MNYDNTNDVIHFLSKCQATNRITYLSERFENSKNVVPTIKSHQSTLPRYFGYYWASNSQVIANSSYTNVSFLDNTWISVNPGTSQDNMTVLITNDLVSLAAFKSCGVQAIIHVSGIFYSNILTKTAFDSDTYTSRWNTYYNAILSYITDGTVLAFYLDEPSNDQLAAVGGLSTIKSTDPALITFITLYPSAVIAVRDGTYTIPDSIDWMSFDEYCVWDADECYGGVSIPGKVNILTTAYPNKKIFLIGQGYKQNPAFTQQQFIDLNLKYLLLYKTLPTCLGILVFAYDTNPSVTVIGMPVLEAYLSEIGKQIITDTM